MKKTKIEWCDSTINPVFGCTYGCEYCYARKLNNRFKWIEEWNKPQFFPQRLKQLNTKRSYNIFMNSMSDIADWKEIWIKETIAAINENPQHNYIFLTKRPLIALDKFGLIKYQVYMSNLQLDMSNLWLGYSYTGGNIDDLFDFIIRAEPYKRFLSIEPLLEETKFKELCKCHLKQIDWIIIGAETGNRKNKIIPKKEWIEEIVKFAEKYKIPVFMKDSLINIVGEENMLREFPKELRRETI